MENHDDFYFFVLLTFCMVLKINPIQSLLITL